MLDGEPKNLAAVDGIPLPDGVKSTKDSKLTTEEKQAEGIAAPFHTLPRVEDPTDDERENALHWYDPDAIPEEGAVPESGYRVLQPVSVEVPDWVVEAVRWRLSHVDPKDIDRQKVEAALHDYVSTPPEFVDRRGEDVVEQLRAEFGSEDDPEA